MENYARKVADFNMEVLGIPPRRKQELYDSEFNISVKCLKEEVEEFIEAYGEHDYTGQVDAMIDLIYFALGVLYKMGVTYEEIGIIADVVHMCNMKKKKGVNERRGDGSAADAVKYEGWVDPQVIIDLLLR